MRGASLNEKLCCVWCFVGEVVLVCLLLLQINYSQVASGLYMVLGHVVS